MPKAELTVEQADAFARLALGHVGREYPNKLDHVLTSDDDLLSPRALHPIFHGSFDWHSCVHGYWMLARVLRRFPAMAAADAVRAQLDEAFTPANVAVELAYLARPSARGFERPYGWAWLLALAAELDRAPEPRWGEVLAPLARAFADHFKAFLPKADYPVRAGAHNNTAFALILALDYAQPSGDSELESLIESRAAAWYGCDRHAQAWEPSQDDFLSPTLVEALCMARILPAERVQTWLSAFLPDLAASEPAALFRPARVSDRSDGKIAHLDGLNLSRAWCWRQLAPWLGAAEQAAALAAAERHLQASLPHVAGDYMGEHWLATFAVLALDGQDASP